jgi:hypothetical protein
MANNIVSIIRNLCLTLVALVIVQGCWSTVYFSIEKFGPKEQKVPHLIIPPSSNPTIPPLQRNHLDLSQNDVATN